MGDTVGAKADLAGSTDAWPGLVQSWVKFAGVCMDSDEAQAAFAAFDSAIERDAGCVDVYYHRGQGESGLVFLFGYLLINQSSVLYVE
jgi:hypothetical protein